MAMKQEIRHLIFGLDVGGVGNDNTVLVLLERVQEYAMGSFEFDKKVKIGKPFYRLRRCDVMPPGTPSPMQFDRVKRTYRKVQDAYHLLMPERKHPMKPILVMDRTGVGGPHFENYREAGLDVYGIHFTSEGNKVNRDGRAWTVPSVDMTSALAVLTENSRLHIPAKIEHREKIIHQLANYKWKRRESGVLSAEAFRDKDHDDICDAIQVAVWYGEWGIREVTTFSKIGLGI